MGRVPAIFSKGNPVIVLDAMARLPADLITCSIRHDESDASEANHVYHKCFIARCEHQSYWHTISSTKDHKPQLCKWQSVPLLHNNIITNSTTTRTARHQMDQQIFSPPGISTRLEQREQYLALRIAHTDQLEQNLILTRTGNRTII